MIVRFLIVLVDDQSGARERPPNRKPNCRDSNGRHVRAWSTAHKGAAFLWPRSLAGARELHAAHGGRSTRYKGVNLYSRLISSIFSRIIFSYVTLIELVTDRADGSASDRSNHESFKFTASAV